MKHVGQLTLAAIVGAALFAAGAYFSDQKPAETAPAAEPSAVDNDWPKHCLNLQPDSAHDACVDEWLAGRRAR